jgi:hypothetical protein
VVTPSPVLVKCRPAHTPKGQLRAAPNMKLIA